MTTPVFIETSKLRRDYSQPHLLKLMPGFDTDRLKDSFIIIV